MSDIKFPRKYTVEEFRSIRLRVPLYQRPYAWEAGQVKQLLDDLYRTFTDSPEEPYYIGILSVAETEGEAHCYDLIDGQQRVTTLALIAKAGGWQDFSGVLDLYGRKDDQDFLAGEGNLPVGANLNPLLPEAYTRAKAYLGAMDDAHRKAFWLYIQKKANFVLAALPDGQDGYSIKDKNLHFVRMNHRGKQLESHEIVKVRLLSLVDEAIRSQYVAIWDHMVRCLTEAKPQEEGQTDSTKCSDSGTAGTLKLKDILERNGDGEAKPESNEVLYKAIVTIPEFLQISLFRYLRLCHHLECDELRKSQGFFDKDKLIQTFDKFLKEDQKVVGFLKLLAAQVETLQRAFVFLSVSEKYALLDHRAFVKESAVGSSRSQGTRIRELIAVQSFLYVSTLPHYWLIPAFDWFSGQSEAIDVGEFVKALEAIDDRLNGKGANSCDFKRDGNGLPEIGALTYGQVGYYWFYRLDYELWKLWQAKGPNNIWDCLKDKEVQNFISEFQFRRCNSIEHIRPQKPDFGNQDVEVDLFGNLALILGTSNSRFSNYKPDGKKDIIRDGDKRVESLKMVHFLWCNQDIQQEGSRMYDILKAVT